MTAEEITEGRSPDVTKQWARVADELAELPIITAEKIHALNVLVTAWGENLAENVLKLSTDGRGQVNADGVTYYPTPGGFTFSMQETGSQGIQYGFGFGDEKVGYELAIGRIGGVWQLVRCAATRRVEGGEPTVKSLTVSEFEVAFREAKQAYRAKSV